MRLRSLTLLVVFLMFFAFAGCEKTSPQLVLKEIGPLKTKAGQGFNVQPNGESAMWFRAENATKTTIAVWGKHG